jgi:hypothetical protein
MGQTIDNDIIFPPCQPFALFKETEQREVEVVQRVVEVSAEQLLREADRIEGIIECIERK